MHFASVLRRDIDAVKKSNRAPLETVRPTGRATASRCLNEKCTVAPVQS
jgi:hypothetical protein